MIAPRLRTVTMSEFPAARQKSIFSMASVKLLHWNCVGSARGSVVTSRFSLTELSTTIAKGNA